MREVCKHGNKDQLEVLVQVRNDEGLDNGGRSGGSESLDLKCIFKVRPAGLTNSLDAWHEEKRKKKESRMGFGQDYWRTGVAISFSQGNRESRGQFKSFVLNM